MRSRPNPVRLLGLFAAAAVALGCGGDDRDLQMSTLALWGRCAATPPCGGDATGRWVSAGLCVPQGYGALSESLSDFPPECGKALSVQALEPDTVLELRADHSFSEKGTLNLITGMRLDASCFGALSGDSFSEGQLPFACDLLQQQLNSRGNGPVDSATCALSDGVCDCTVTGTQPLQSSGSFEVRGDTLLRNAEQSQRFCSAGDTLTIEVDDPMFGQGLLVYRRAE